MKGGLRPPYLVLLVSLITSLAAAFTVDRRLKARAETEPGGNGRISCLAGF